jgi:hypothetical protein
MRGEKGEEGKKGQRRRYMGRNVSAERIIWGKLGILQNEDLESCAERELGRSGIDNSGMHLQVSGNGGCVATFDQHHAFVWPADVWEPQALKVPIPKVVSVSPPMTV